MADGGASPPSPGDDELLLASASEAGSAASAAADDDDASSAGLDVFADSLSRSAAGSAASAGWSARDAAGSGGGSSAGARAAGGRAADLADLADLDEAFAAPPPGRMFGTDHAGRSAGRQLGARAGQGASAQDPHGASASLSGGGSEDDDDDADDDDDNDDDGLEAMSDEDNDENDLGDEGGADNQEPSRSGPGGGGRNSPIDFEGVADGDSATSGGDLSDDEEDDFDDDEFFGEHQSADGQSQNSDADSFGSYPRHPGGVRFGYDDVPDGDSDSFPSMRMQLVDSQLAFWGNSFVMFSSIGIGLWIGSLVFKVDFERFLGMVMLGGFGLLAARPRYNPGMSASIEHGMSDAEIETIRTFVRRRVDLQSADFDHRDVFLGALKRSSYGQRRSRDNEESFAYQKRRPQHYYPTPEPFEDMLDVDETRY